MSAKHAGKEKDMPDSPVYLVTESATGIPVAAFTVKDEMQTWLYQRQTIQGLVHLRLWEIQNSSYWHGKVPEPFPLDPLYQYHEGEAIITRRTTRG